MGGGEEGGGTGGETGETGGEEGGETGGETGETGGEEGGGTGGTERPVQADPEAQAEADAGEISYEEAPADLDDPELDDILADLGL